MADAPKPEDYGVTQAANNIKNYQDAPFNYNVNNPVMTALKSQFGQQQTAESKNMARSDSARGMTDSGQLQRDIAGRQASSDQFLQNAVGQDSQRQYAQYVQQNQTRYQQALGAYNVSNDMYKNASDQYWQDQTLKQQQALTDWQKQTQQSDMWSKLLGGIGQVGGALLGSTILPGIGTKIGASLGGALGQGIGGLL